MTNDVRLLREHPAVRRGQPLRDLPDISTWKRILAPLTLTDGGIYEDPQRCTYYVKRYTRDLEIWTELAACAAYSVAGLPCATPFAALMRNRLVLVSPWINGATSLHYYDVRGTEDAIDNGILLDMALGNSDLYTMVPQPLLPPLSSPLRQQPVPEMLHGIANESAYADDITGWFVNLVRDADGSLLRLDNGGSLRNFDPAARHFDGNLPPIESIFEPPYLSEHYFSLPGDPAGVSGALLDRLRADDLRAAMLLVGMPAGLAIYYAKLIEMRVADIATYFAMRNTQTEEIAA
jgi:hypothetical protein